MTAQPTTEFGPVEAFVNAYESVRAREEVPIRQFLPPRDDPRFVPALAELIRVEMEYAWADGRPRRLADYREEYPELFTDPLALAAVAFEEYRLRRHAAEPVSRDEYVRNFGVDTSTWPDEFESVQELSQRLAETEALFPDVGQTIAGFRLERELGRGAFGRVYLARQGDLADRPVALKIAADVGVESRVLARLQHTNVMPVYSVHRSGPFQAVCMPFFPAVTLADLCRSLSKRETVPDSGRALLDTLRARTALAGQNLSSDPSAPELAPPPVKANLDLLAGVSFVKAVVWLGARLADGLAHAHDRGIVHRDLKPANVLLTDEGQPLILDFNLAADMNPSAEQARAALGGTLPYMPPEHLQAFRDRKPYRDPRGDVYALGLILYELLAARHPFPVRRGDPDRSLAQMIADRERAPDVRPFNRSVPRGLEAILCKCLEADPSKRYPTARELAEDLQRQFDDQPLLHAREPLREQFGKWRRRHPRLTSWFTVGGIAAALLLAGALTVRGLMQRNETLETRDLATRFHADFEDTHFRAAFPVPIDATPPDAAGQMTAFRERWERVLTANLAEPPWTEALPPDELARLRREVGDSYYLLVEELIHRPDAHSPDTWREALELNGRAQSAYPVDEVPRAVWIQRAKLFGLLTFAAGQAEAESNAVAAPVRGAHDYLWTANEQLQRGNRTEALRLLQEAARLDPNDPLIHAYLGFLHLTARRPAQAIEHYGLSIGLYPIHVPRTGDDSRAPPVTYLARGLSYFQAKRLIDAERDFDDVIARRPDYLDTYMNRTLTRLELGNFAGALADVNEVLKAEPERTDALFLRARVHRSMGDHAGANADRAAGLKSVPTTARGWHSRSANQPKPMDALADIDMALKLEPDRVEALQHRANVLDGLGRSTEALAMLNELLEKWPEFVPGRAGRAVLLARSGRDDESLTDAAAVLKSEPEPIFVYQVAGAYALMSPRKPETKRTALDLLASAFRREPTLVRHVPSDPDLAPLSGDVEFKKLVEAAAVLGRK